MTSITIPNEPQMNKSMISPPKSSFNPPPAPPLPPPPMPGTGQGPLHNFATPNSRPNMSGGGAGGGSARLPSYGAESSFNNQQSAAAKQAVPDALLKALNSSPMGKKPFTYTPGGLDLSHVRQSARVKR